MTVKVSMLARLVILTLLTAAALAGGAAAQQGPCPRTFFAAMLQMVPCRSAVFPFSPYPPTDECCNAVREIGQPCLCLLVNGPPITGIDRGLALQLPIKCAIDYQPCNPGL